MSDVKFTDNSAKILEELKSRAKTALGTIGAVAETHAKELTPVKTGYLRNSITYALYNEAPAISSYSSDDRSKTGSYSGNAPMSSSPAVYIGTNVEYAPNVEFGTSRQKAHHMLKKAATEHSAEYKAIAKDILGG